MAVSEYRRHHVLQWYEKKMPPDLAETMMELLPNVTWNDIATKDDLAALGTSIRGEVKADIAQATRSIFFAMVASQATLVGLVLAAVKLG